MKIKDFKVGSTVYELSQKEDRLREFYLTKCRVVSVGRKYVKAVPINQKDDCFPGEYCATELSDQYLERYDTLKYCPEKLFLTEAAMNDYVEAEKLRFWLRRACDLDIDFCTVEQLREVKRILEGKNHK